jgi:hypothetical protein
VLNSRQTEVQTVQTIDTGPKNSLCVVSSVLRNGHAAEKHGRGTAGAHGGRGMAGSPQPILDFKANVMFSGTRVMGVFDGDCSLGGGG